ncbi:MAG: hypothetical protein M3137_19830 [Actinomycetota bacterium]|nr:hypothetical protein [Actinomycetota bacterium]
MKSETVQRHNLPGATRAGQLRRAAVMAVVAVVLIAAVKPFGPVAYHWIPVITGGGLALAAFVGGRGSRLMGGAMPVLFWGIAIVVTSDYKIPGDYALITGMIGLGAIAAYLLSEAGWHSNALPVGLGIVLLGAGEYIHGTFGSWATYAFAMLAGLVVIAELAGVPTARRRNRQATPGAPDLEPTSSSPSKDVLTSA